MFLVQVADCGHPSDGNDGDRLISSLRLASSWASRSVRILAMTGAMAFIDSLISLFLAPFFLRVCIISAMLFFFLM